MTEEKRSLIKSQADEICRLAQKAVEQWARSMVSAETAETTEERKKIYRAAKARNTRLNDKILGFAEEMLSV